ncbi:MAG: V-type ATP synthase subunit F [Methanomassiliicoccales archaeon]
MPAAKGYGSIAVIGERELVLGFRLLGIANAFAVNVEEGKEKLRELMSNGDFSLILVSETLRKGMDRKLLESIENSALPLVVFIPLPGGKEEESVEKLAKRVLGVEIGR